MTRITKQQLADQQAAEQHALQQAELKRLRAEKRAARKTNIEAAKPAFDPAAEDAARRAKMESAMADLMEGFALPSWKRVVCGVVFGMLLAAGTGWTIGVLAGMLIATAVAMTGMAWIGYVIAVLAIVVSCMTSGRFALWGFGYITEGRIDDQALSVKQRVTSWFKRGDIVQFSGAHAA